MLLTFDGKGCSNCPFNAYVLMAKVWRCNLNSRILADGIKLKLIPSDNDERPRGCPFRLPPKALEIQANE